MSIEISTEKNVCSLKIIGDLTIFQMSEYHQLLVSEGIFKDQLELDFSLLEEVDTAGIQLILSLEKEVNKAGGKVTIIAKNSVLDEGLAVLNLLQHFKFSTEVL